EFLSHYYGDRRMGGAGRRRPREAYLFGFVQAWVPYAARMPRLFNALTHAPVLSTIAKSLAGIDSRRTIPAVAARTFRTRWNARPQRHSHQRRVILWADTFTDHFHPDTADAAVAVLEDAGFAVDVPSYRLCCGRPLYDFGFLDRAKRYLTEIMSAL